VPVSTSETTSIRKRSGTASSVRARSKSTPTMPRVCSPSRVAWKSEQRPSGTAGVKTVAVRWHRLHIGCWLDETIGDDKDDRGGILSPTAVEGIDS